MLAVSRKVSAMLVGTLGVMSSMPSWLGEAEVKSIVGGCPAMEETSRRNSNHSKRKEVQGRQESPQPGFDLLVGCPFPLDFFFSDPCFVFVLFFCTGWGAGSPGTNGEIE